VIQSEKPGLSFYTNMPTPYQLDFLDALKDHFVLKAIFFTKIENDRQWKLSVSGGYDVIFLKNSWLARIIHKKITSFHFSWKIINVLLKDDSRFIIVNGTYWSPNVVLSFIIGYLRRKKVFFYGEPIFESSSPVQRWVKKYILAFALRYFTHGILAIGKKAMDGYASFGYKRLLYNIPYNINTDLFKEQNIDADLFEKLKKKWKANGEIILLSSGSLTHRKGMDTLITAFLRIPDLKNVRLLIMGDGPDRSELEAMTLHTSCVTFLGFCEKEEIPAYFRLADIFVFASRYDGWGLVINEAIAGETAIIASVETGAAFDKIVPNINGLLVKAGDIEGYKTAMMELIANPERRRLLIENNKELIKELSSAYNAKIVYDICAAIK
jgi:glycosyltransferase involved in cell wall biosynthesis